MCHRDSAQGRGRDVAKRLKEVIDRQQFEVVVHAKMGARPFAKERIPPYRYVRLLRGIIVNSTYGYTQKPMHFYLFLRTRFGPIFLWFPKSIKYVLVQCLYTLVSVCFIRCIYLYIPGIRFCASVCFSCFVFFVPVCFFFIFFLFVLGRRCCCYCCCRMFCILAQFIV